MNNHTKSVLTFSVGSGYGAMGQCYDGYPKEPILGGVCMNQIDCSTRYSYADCEWSTGMPGVIPGSGTRMCYCRCGYKFDINSQSCISRDWWYNSGVILAIIITILVIVIVVAVFTIPTCALVSCWNNKQ